MTTPGATHPHRPDSPQGAEIFRAGSCVVGTGAAVPEHVRTNRDLEKMVDTSDEWIVTRTGIRERRIAGVKERTSQYAARAALAALEASGVRAADLDLVLVATTTPDQRFPATANYVQEIIGASRACGYDIAAACCGFVFALAAADAQIRAGVAECALVIGADLYSAAVDWKDRDTCVLFGDGAGAVVLKGQTGHDHAHRAHGPGDARGPRGILAVAQHSAPSGIGALACGGGGTAGRAETLCSAPGTIRMEGRKVFRLAVESLDRIVREVVAKAGCRVEDLDWVVPHQANRRIVEEVVARLGYGMGRVVMNLDRYGNAAAASIPIAWDEAVRDGRIKTGDLVLLAAAGAGFSAGAALIRM